MTRMSAAAQVVAAGSSGSHAYSGSSTARHDLSEPFPQPRHREIDERAHLGGDAFLRQIKQVHGRGRRLVSLENGDQLARLYRLRNLIRQHARESEPGDCAINGCICCSHDEA